MRILFLALLFCFSANTAADSSVLSERVVNSKLALSKLQQTINEESLQYQTRLELK